MANKPSSYIFQTYKKKGIKAHVQTNSIEPSESFLYTMYCGAFYHAAGRLVLLIDYHVLANFENQK